MTFGQRIIIFLGAALIASVFGSITAFLSQYAFELEWYWAGPWLVALAVSMCLAMLSLVFMGFAAFFQEEWLENGESSETSG